jgi:predicted nucleic acid-binding Zn ribbon protein
MSTTLLWIGLWLIAIVMGLFIAKDVASDAPFLQWVTTALLVQGGALGIVLTGAGIVLRLFERVAPKSKRRCVVCRKPVFGQEMYCREHLRGILEEEDERTHRTRTHH